MIVQASHFPIATVNRMDVNRVPKFPTSFSPDSNGINNNSEKLVDTGFYLTKEVRSIDDDFDSEFDEEVDEEFSDDEFLPEELHQSQQKQTTNDNDVTKQLLKFAEMVNGDIKKFFGKKADDDESCDIYQDKWTSGKSGRELYYAELLKIAQGGDPGDGDTKSKNDSGSKNKNLHDLAKEKYSGKMNTKIGIGPLSELFDYGLRDYINDNNANQSSKHKRLKEDFRKYESIIPMSDRKLPRSFWKEPGNNCSIVPKTGILDSTKVMDFSDLVDNLNTVESAEENVHDVTDEFDL